jgi:hypothetical protein
VCVGGGGGGVVNAYAVHNLRKAGSNDPCGWYIRFSKTRKHCKSVILKIISFSNSKLKLTYPF